ncbi:smoothelin-like 1 [Hoplias malabaricus]|uniref:smoothelin-like 1 n=1 Tax=Hoplias malabaricus TaxID=27720 RepID=UPI00346318AA
MENSAVSSVSEEEKTEIYTEGFPEEEGTGGQGSTNVGEACERTAGTNEEKTEEDLLTGTREIESGTKKTETEEKEKESENTDTEKEKRVNENETGEEKGVKQGGKNDREEQKTEAESNAVEDEKSEEEEKSEEGKGVKEEKEEADDCVKEEKNKEEKKNEQKKEEEKEEKKEQKKEEEKSKSTLTQERGDKEAKVEERRETQTEKEKNRERQEKAKGKSGITPSSSSSLFSSRPRSARHSARREALAKFQQDQTPGVRNFKVQKTSVGVASGASIKQKILQWCRSKTRGYEGVSVENFSSSWSDGMAFCALVHRFFPDAFDFSALKTNEREKNFTLAFSTAESLAGCCPLLDVSDMLLMGNKPDPFSVFTYVQSLCQSLSKIEIERKERQKKEREQNKNETEDQRKREGEEEEEVDKEQEEEEKIEEGGDAEEKCESKEEEAEGKSSKLATDQNDNVVNPSEGQ